MTEDLAEPAVDVWAGLRDAIRPHPYDTPLPTGATHDVFGRGSTTGTRPQPSTDAIAKPEERP